jgi:hypothetical protein
MVRQALVCGIFHYTANMALASELVFAKVLLLKCYFSIATVFLFLLGSDPKARVCLHKEDRAFVEPECSKLCSQNNAI